MSSEPAVEITWTPDLLREFKQSYKKAVKDKVIVFTFKGNQFILKYAEYLIEYLDNQFDGQR